MADLTTIPPGGMGTFTAQPLDQAGNPASLPSGVTPVWSVSDATVGTIAAATSDPTGLTGTLTVATIAVAGTAFNVVITATMPDGTTPTGSIAQTVASLEVSSFRVNRTA